MAEILEVRGSSLPQIVRVIRCGLEHGGNLESDVYDSLKKWCDEEEGYSDRMGFNDVYDSNYNLVVSAGFTNANETEDTSEIVVRDTYGGSRFIVAQKSDNMLWESISKVVMENL